MMSTRVTLTRWLALVALAGCTASPNKGLDGQGTGGAGLAGAIGSMRGAGGTISSGGMGGTGASTGASGSGARGAGASGAGGSAGGGGNAGAGATGGLAAGGGGGVSSADGGTGGTKVTAGSGCAGTNYLLCEDFEAAAVDGTPSGWTKHGDASGVTADIAHGGTKSLKLGPIAVWERRIYHDASTLGSAHWGRIYFKVQLPVPDAFVHSTLVALSGVGPTWGASEFRVVDTVKQANNTPNVASRIQFLWNVQPQSADEFGEGTNYDREFDDAWHCAEWHIDAATQAYAFFLDGKQLISFEKGAGNFAGSDIPSSFQELKVGWINYQDAPPGFTAWIDDIALDDARVGCL